MFGLVADEYAEILPNPNKEDHSVRPGFLMPAEPDYTIASLDSPKEDDNKAWECLLRHSSSGQLSDRELLVFREGALAD